MNEEMPKIVESPDINAMAAKYDQKVVESGGKVAFDAEKFEVNGEGAKKVRLGLNILLEFVNSPIITDEFKDHDERRAFRKKLFDTDPEYYAVLDKNKLRVNRISQVNVAFSIILNSIDSTDIPEEVKEKIKLLDNEFPKRETVSRETMSTEEKVDEIKQIDAVIIKLFNLLDYGKI